MTTENVSIERRADPRSRIGTFRWGACQMCKNKSGCQYGTFGTTLNASELPSTMFIEGGEIYCGRFEKREIGA